MSKAQEEYVLSGTLGKSSLFPYLLALMSIKRIGGLFYAQFSLLMPVIGFLGFCIHQKISTCVMPLLFIGALSLLSGLTIDYDPISFLRGMQLILMFLFFNFLILHVHTEDIKKAHFLIIPLIFAVFLLEVVVKQDLRNAIVSIDLGFFRTSGGTEFEGAGVQLVASGNVYAAALAGICAIVSFMYKRPYLGTIALILSILTGSRALLLAYAILGLVWLAHKISPKLRSFSLIVFIAGLLIQPVVYANIETLLGDNINSFLKTLSPRYMSYIAFSQMGFDHPLLGVGYFTGITFEDYFYIFWPQYAHNVFLVIWGEIGIFAYFFWAFFLINFYHVVKNSYNATIIFFFTFIMYSFVDAFNEWGFWVPLALAYKLGWEAHSCRQDPYKEASEQGVARNFQPAKV